MFRGLFNTFIWMYMALKCSFSMPCCFATNQKSLPLPWSSSHSPASLVLLARSSLPRRSPASFLLWQILPWQQQLLLGSSQSVAMATGVWSVLPTWVRNAQQLCWQRNWEQVTSWTVPATGTVSAEGAGCQHTWHDRCKLSNYFFSSNGLQTASNLWIHSARNLKMRFLQRKTKLQKKKCFST